MQKWSFYLRKPSLGNSTGALDISHFAGILHCSQKEVDLVHVQIDIIQDMSSLFSACHRSLLFAYFGLKMLNTCRCISGG